MKRYMLGVTTSVGLETHGRVTAVKGTVGFQGVTMDVYVFLLDNVLIDTGSNSLLGDFKQFFSDLVYDMVALTHSHEDHTGGARWIQEHRKVPFYIHPMSISECRDPDDYPVYRKLIWGTKEGFDALPLSDTIVTAHDKLDVVYTPGHAADHMSFYSNELGVLFTGDLYVTPKPKIILRHESVSDTMDSIRRLMKYDFQTVFCSHAGYLSDGRALLQMKLDYLEDISGRIIDLHNRGFSVQEMNQTLFPNPKPLIAFSQHEWDSEHMIRSVLGAVTSG